MNTMEPRLEDVSGAGVRSARRTARQAGFTLVEMMVVLGLATLVMGSIMSTLQGGTAAFEQGSALSNLSTKVERALDRIAAEMAYAGAENTTPGVIGVFGSEWVEFQQCTGSEQGVTTWGNLERLAFELMPLETADGRDENNNGLVDEGQVVLRRSLGSVDEVRLVLASNVAALLEGEARNADDDNGNGLVDEPGLVFSRSDDVITVRLTLEQVGPDGSVLQESGTRSFLLKN